MNTKYTNGIKVSINELVFLDFIENSQSYNGSVARVALTYDAFKQIVEAMNRTIADHDAKLDRIVNEKKMSN